LTVFGRFSTIFDCFSTNFDRFSTNFALFSAVFRPILTNFDHFSTIFDHFWPFFDRFRPFFDQFRPISAYFRPIFPRDSEDPSTSSLFDLLHAPGPALDPARFSFEWVLLGARNEGQIVGMGGWSLNRMCLLGAVWGMGKNWEHLVGICGSGSGNCDFLKNKQI
jgi:hypothetical protein